MSRGLGTVQRRALELIGPSQRGLTVAELAGALGIKPRRCRQVVEALHDRREIEVTREQIGTQPSGRPVHGLVVWNRRALFDRNADAWSQARRATAIAASAEAALEHQARLRGLCPCCGQTIPSELSVPLGTSGEKRPSGTLPEPRASDTLTRAPAAIAQPARSREAIAPASRPFDSGASASWT